MSRGARFRDLPLFWKLLVPFLTLMLIVGMLGAFVIVRDLSQRAQTQLDADLASRSLDTRSLFHDRELYLLESANFAANLQGMAVALQAGDTPVVQRLLASVRALKSDLDLVVATDRNGIGVVEFTRTSFSVQQGAATDWATSRFVQDALTSASGDKTSGFLTIGDTNMVAIAAPVCTDVTVCSPAGVAITAIRTARLAQAARVGRSGIGIYTEAGKRLASAGFAPSRAVAAGTGRRLVRQRITLNGTEVETLAAPLTVQGRKIGVLAVSIPTRPAFSAVRNAGRRLALVLLAAMAGIVAIGAGLSRFILSQVRPLVHANRALGSGDLNARASVLGQDELGELAAGFNEMAAQLQANVATLESRVEERTEEVRRLLRERTEFFAGLSHELRTPLAIIRNQADFVAEEADAQLAETGRVMSDSAEQLLELVNDILDMTRAEVSSVDVELEPVRLGDVMHDLKPNLTGLARAAGLDLSAKVPPDLPLVRADPTRLRQVVLNLVDNAVKYTPSGGKIGVVASAVNGHIELAVSDTGVGIPDDARDQLFRPFFRVNGTRTQHGQSSSGLGLALTKRLVEAQGGSIDFTSALGAGSTFVVRLQPATDSGDTPA